MTRYIHTTWLANGKTESYSERQMERFINGKYFHRLLHPDPTYDPEYKGREWNWYCYNSKGEMVMFHDLKEVKAYKE